MSVVSIQAEVAVLREKANRFDEDFRRLERVFNEDIKRLEDDIKVLQVDKIRLENMASRWKGGVAVLIALGSFVGMMLSQIDNIKSFLKVG
jgi:hypothetical protein